MGTETLIVFLTCGFILLVIIISSWYRRKKLAEKESTGGISRIQETIINGQRTFRIATVSRQAGRLALEVYEIRLPRANDPNSTATITLLPSPTTQRINNHLRGQPPPPFSTAINMPSPSSNNSEGVTTMLYAENCEGSLVPPPPRYDEVMSISIISGSKVSEQNASTAHAATSVERTAT